MDNFLAVIWDPNSVMFKFFGLSIRYYSLMWVIGLVGGYMLEKSSITTEACHPMSLIRCFCIVFWES